MAKKKRAWPDGVTVSLIELREEGEASRHVIKQWPADLGHGLDNDAVLSGPGVAEAHARLSWSEEGVVLSDLSGGATRVNDHAVTRARLQNGDILELGETRLLLQLTDTRAEGMGPPPPQATQKDFKPRVWAAGFSEDFRKWFRDLLSLDAGVETEAFRTGEEVLVATSKALAEGRAPVLIILDLRIPLVNGINVAIALRAFELGYNRKERVPLVFLFDPPDTNTFEKVVRFCQPVQVVSPAKSKSELKARIKGLIGQATSNRS